MTETIVLEATKRALAGKEVRHLRGQGVIPGVLYGPAFNALPLQIEWTSLRPVLREAGGSQLIELTVDDEKHNALIRDVQRDPIRGDVLHVDFYRVRMDVAIRTDVPIVLIGDASIIEEAGGVVNLEMNTITVECLPADLPAHIEVDVAQLQEIGDTIVVGALPTLDGVTYMADEADAVVSTQYLARPEEEEVIEEEAEFEEGAEPELVGREDEEEIED